jgi:hypothetical protein
LKKLEDAYTITVGCEDIMAYRGDLLLVIGGQVRGVIDAASEAARAPKPVAPKPVAPKPEAVPEVSEPASAASCAIDQEVAPSAPVTFSLSEHPLWPNALILAAVGSGRTSQLICNRLEINNQQDRRALQDRLRAMVVDGLLNSKLGDHKRKPTYSPTDKGMAVRDGTSQSRAPQGNDATDTAPESSQTGKRASEIDPTYPSGTMHISYDEIVAAVSAIAAKQNHPWVNTTQISDYLGIPKDANVNRSSMDNRLNRLVVRNRLHFNKPRGRLLYSVKS